MYRFIVVILVAAVLHCLAAGQVDAAVQFTSETVIYSGPPIIGPYDPSSSFSQGPSDSDLLAGLAPTESAGNFSLGYLTGLPALTDGSIISEMTPPGPDVITENSVLYDLGVGVLSWPGCLLSCGNELT